MTPEEKIFLLKLLSNNEVIEEEPHRCSCFSLALKGARYNVGRNIETGKYHISNNKSAIIEGLYFTKMFTGITLYLILLEQIGTLVKKKGIKFTNGIKVAIASFVSPSLSVNEIEAIYSLRNSLSHNFGLANEKKYINSTQHKYSLSFNADDPLIKIPNPKWNGSYSDKSHETLTKVGIYAFASLVEGIIASCLEEIENDNVELLLCIDEVTARFTIIA